MEEKGKYSTEGEQPNSKQSPQAGGKDTNATKADAAAIMVSVLAMMRRAGWHVEIRNGNQTGYAYVIIPDAFWQSVDGILHLEEK